MAKQRQPVTRYQRGRRWATFILLICGAFSIGANVRSGVIELGFILISVYPPIVSFGASHLITYLNPRNIGQKILVWAGMGIPVLFSMIVSGQHIVTTVMEYGQNMIIAIMYVFITDVPMLVAGVILAMKVPTSTQAGQNRADVPKPVTTPVKATQPAKATGTAKRTPPAKAAKAAKATQPTFKAPLPDIRLDERENEMLNA